MNSLKKIQAFTLGELLVVMVISSIVVTISFMALGNVQKQVQSIKTAFDRQQKILSFERLLLSDLHAYKAEYLADKKQLIFENSNERVRYELLNDKIIRGIDTVQLPVQQIQLYLEGEKVSSGRFDAIEFSFSDTYNQQGFFIYKQNDGAHYINH